MGRQSTVIARHSGGTILEIDVVETTELTQLISGSILVRTDQDVIDKGWGFVIKENIRTGNIVSGGIMRIPAECKKELWILDPWTREYETEKDVS